MRMDLHQPFRDLDFPLEFEFGFDPAFTDWTFTLSFSPPLSELQRGMLENLLTGWYEVGVWGGFQPSSLSNMTDSEIEADAQRTVVRWVVDKGSSDMTEALRVLILCLQSYSRTTAARPGEPDQPPRPERLLIGMDKDWAFWLTGPHLPRMRIPNDEPPSQRGGSR
jgi:hypothetical protein